MALLSFWALRRALTIPFGSAKIEGNPSGLITLSLWRKVVRGDIREQIPQGYNKGGLPYFAGRALDIIISTGLK